MKLVFLILCAFFLSFAFHSEARDLSVKEKLSLINYERNQEVLEELVANIRANDLSIPEYLSFQIHKKGCLPVRGLKEKIERENDEYKDQSLLLKELDSVCAQSISGIAKLYLLYK
ncbi:hypothetical protein M899_1896 [Bacteriovorax sp. BSW11_IV]|uniref:hypothetical protein n=1 Tax=Bacteriovorax sp. BSW11_IV TaxID=1353529 RepID=UPI00038A002B|nr:hypothetical protein [Bacteriovorax sp. BSW11_IV]EQC48435.1 hypothetical protein M899_1896 [Bacteriovorax sp. BSW11_IV]